jgi:hypothetical protein
VADVTQATAEPLLTAAADLDPDIVRLQDAFLADNRRRKRWIILETAEGYEVHVHTVDGVAPPSSYPNKRLAVARLMQLLGTGPVRPQTHPEVACIGHLEHDDAS